MDTGAPTDLIYVAQNAGSGTEFAVSLPPNTFRSAGFLWVGVTILNSQNMMAFDSWRGYAHGQCNRLDLATPFYFGSSWTSSMIGKIVTLANEPLIPLITMDVTEDNT